MVDPILKPGSLFHRAVCGESGFSFWGLCASKSEKKVEVPRPVPVCRTEYLVMAVSARPVMICSTPYEQGTFRDSADGYLDESATVSGQDFESFEIHSSRGIDY